MKTFIAIGFLVVCLSSQARSSPAITLKDYYKQNVGERIISGEPASLGLFPYQAAVFQTFPNGKGAFCGGTLISSRWVLTAAHCAQGVSYWDVKLGGIRNDQYEPTQVLLRSYRGIIHPGYNQYLHNDVALISLPQDVTFSKYIQPLRLPALSEIQPPGDYYKVTVSGWGYTFDGSTNTSPYLNYVSMTTIPNNVCRDTYGPSIISSTICAVGNPEHSPCQGDSGGPLTYVAADGYMTLAGVVSFVHKSGCASGNPSAYARTASYLDWINQNTGIPIRQ